MISWILQLVDSSAFTQPKQIQAEIDIWCDANPQVKPCIGWGDNPYPKTITLTGGWPAPDLGGLMEAMQPKLSETEYMVLAFVGNGMLFDNPITLYVVTPTLLASMSGSHMIQELVKQLHVAAAPAAGLNNSE